MSRYIDADAFMQDINNSIAEMTELGITVDGGYLWGKMNDALENAPSIEIIHCRECSKHNTHRCHMAFDLVATKDDDFCSYGKPKEELKGSERLVKGSKQTDCQTCKWWSSYGYCVHRECKGYEPQTERSK